MKCRAPALIWFLALAALPAIAFGQAAPTERTFSVPKPAVDTALRSLQASAGGRLPTLEGFIADQPLALDRLQRPHYTYAVEVLSKPPGSLVRVRAHITAWFAGPTAAQSGYRELPSNGRLESDLLERLEENLAPISPAAHPTAQPITPQPKAVASEPKAIAPNALFATPRPGAVSLPPRSAVDSTSAPNHDSASYARALREQADNLEEILRNQTHPTDLAAVRKAKTPVYSRPSEGGEVLFLADAHDEFQVLNTSSEWVHVQISGISRGWIRGPDLELPARAGISAAAKATPVPAPSAPVPPAPVAATTGPAFHLTHQEVNTYPGDWAPLRGKSVRILSLAPTAAGPTNPSQKWESARTMFQRAAIRLATPDSAAVEGVVLIFDSADGGMASATATSLREWDAGRLSDEAFRAQCSFDPPEAFKQ